MNILQKINAVMKQVSYLQKDVTVGGKGSYKAVSHDNVLAALRPAMVEAGIITRPEIISSEIVQLKDYAKDIKQTFYSARYNIHFVNIDDPADFLTVTTESHAQDSGDKSCGKACSMAVKYAMLKVFGIETGENEESRNYEAQAFTDLQKNEFHEFIQNNKDGLGFACFQATVGPDVMEALTGTFEKGKISSGKETMRKLVREGYEVLNAAVEQIREAINNGDEPGLLQVLAEFEAPAEKRLLAGLLDHSELEAIKSAKSI